ncbi:pectinesterase family protein [Hymenobacter sp. GOD-10R]|uniref:pectinesterase family protein n=1 Tax=Hymenobacter sp. GOD-10R TaxID=3093922 RepID=UPI002D78D632|nr:pectinesterase family protein [Hymenobacter sp. GOD-10R]WRQ26159.1 pectinesterase family protein [Hymenobacter sp. GOD-10R]
MKQCFTLLRHAGAAWLFVLVALTGHAQSYDAVVAKDGTGNFTTVQAAINAAPTGRTTPYTIYVKNGKYKEKVTVPTTKPFLQLIGQSVAGVILTGDDYNGKPNPAGGTFSATTSATVTISGPDFSALNITFENTTGDSPQALAMRITADRVAFKNCRFLGGQDTVYTNTNNARNYFKDCYIDGTVDFIYGGARGLFEGCVIYPKTRRDGGSGGYITAANTPQNQAYGYVFRKCYIPANRGTTTYTLGRPWGNDASNTNANRSHNKVVWLSTIMGPNVIKPEGWSSWDAGTNTSVITYAEYKSRDISGNLLDVSQRVPWSIQLTDADTATYTRTAMLGTWDPCTVYPNFCPSQAPEIAITNFMAVKGTATAPSAFTWNASWPIADVQYQVLRSTTRKGSYTLLYTTTAANATDVNFAATDAVPAPGGSYFYYVQASKAGMTMNRSDTLQIARPSTITTTGALQPFLQGVGQPSTPQSVQVSGENLTADLVITPPAGFQVSSNGTTWYTSTTPLTLAQTDNTVASTIIRVRLNASAAGTYSGTLTLASPGATASTLPVSGTTQTAPLPQSSVVQWWPMTRNNQDSTAVRSAAVLASVPSFRKLVLSSGSATATIPPYSAQYGQAFAPQAEGAWLTAAGGNGGNLNRTYYEQFQVVPTGGLTMRVDSLLLTSYVTGSTSSTKLAVVWSKTGFFADSADVSGGWGPTGSLLSTANGGFATPILLGSQSTYRLAFAGTSGVTLQPDQRLTFRVYYSCGSGSTSARFATLRNVVVKGGLNIITATRSASAKVLQLYPNPVTNQATLVHPVAAHGVVRIYSALGQCVATIACAAGSQQTPLNLQGLANGHYLVHYTDGHHYFSAPLQKQ